MTANTTATIRNPTTERAIGAATSAAPVITGMIAPFLDGGATIAATLTYAAAAGFTAANYMDRLPASLTDNLPATDILHAHRTTLGISTITTGMALFLGTFGGPNTTDALMAGILDPTHPIPFIASAGWWGAVALVPYKLRRVLARKPRPARLKKTATAQAATRFDELPPDRQITYLWAQHISNPDTGSHKGQELTLRALSTHRWQGTITARVGQSVTVSKDTMSSVYRKPADWITF